MADENKTPETQQDENKQEQPEQAAEKKYTDADVNTISKKNSDKAVAKLLKELGIDATDEGRAAAKQILADAKAKTEAAKTEQQKTEESNGKVQAAIARATLAEGTVALIGKGVPAERAARFAKLLDLSSVADENGDIDADKMAAAVDSLLKTFPEALPKAEEKVGFKVGSNGKETKDNSVDAEMEEWRKAARLK